MTSPQHTGTAGRSLGRGYLSAGAGYTPALPAALACRFWTRSAGHSTAQPRSPTSAGRSHLLHLCGDSGECAQPGMFPWGMVGLGGHPGETPQGTAGQGGQRRQHQGGQLGRLGIPHGGHQGRVGISDHPHEGQWGHSSRATPLTFGSGEPGSSWRPSSQSLSANLVQLRGFMGRLRRGAEPCGRQEGCCHHGWDPATPSHGHPHRVTPRPSLPEPCRPSPLLQVVPGQHMASRRQRLRRLRQARQSGAPPPRAAPPQNSSGPQSSSSAQGKGWVEVKEEAEWVSRPPYPPSPARPPYPRCVYPPPTPGASSLLHSRCVRPPIPPASPLLPAG